MNTEEDEFKRIEAEAKRRAQADDDTQVYAKPWVGLTDEEISDLWCKVSNTDFVTADTHVFARAIEAAHNIKEQP